MTDSQLAIEHEIALIVAVSENGVIGNGPDIPWRLPEDQQFFQRMTTGHAVIMGRATWDTLGRPLPNRTSVVLSRQRELSVPGVFVAHYFEQAVALAAAHPPPEQEEDKTIFVIGGAAVYEAALPHSQLAYVTRVRGTFEGDVHFEAFQGDGPEGWQRVSVDPHAIDERHATAFDIETWRADGD